MLKSVVTVCALFAQPALAQFGFTPQIIAKTGQPVFGGSGATFGGFQPAPINSSGAIAFSAGIRQQSTTLSGLYKWQVGSSSEVARTGNPLGNYPGLSFIDLHAPNIDDSGRLAFSATYGQGSGQVAFLTSTPVGLRVEGISGISNPAIPCIPAASIHSQVLSRSGKLTLVDGDQYMSKFWTGTFGDLAVAANSQMAAPGYAGCTLQNLGWTRVSDSGRNVLLGQLYGGQYSGERAYLTADRSSARVPVGPGVAAPNGQGTFTSAGAPPSINGAGVLGFTALCVSQPGAPAKIGAWLGAEGSFSPIATVGDPAPGLPAGYSFAGLDTPAVTHSGDALFYGYATAAGQPNKQALWRYTSGSLNLALTPGQPVVNMPSGTVVAAQLDWTSDTYKSATVNDLNQVLLITALSIPGQGLHRSLIASIPGVGVQAIASEGLPYQLAPGDTRTISDISMWNSHTSGSLAACTGDDGYGSPLNDSGQLAFVLYFNDSSSAFVMVQVPAPGFALPAVSLLAIAARRRRP